MDRCCLFVVVSVMGLFLSYVLLSVMSAFVCCLCNSVVFLSTFVCVCECMLDVFVCDVYVCVSLCFMTVSIACVVVALLCVRLLCVFVFVVRIPNRC